jgi:sulfite reductase beta subunit-like hemoprotein
MASGVERIKSESAGMRGPIAMELDSAEARGGLSESAYTLLKFHGTYEQHDRDTATARKQAGEDKDWSFMVRVRMPAGRLTAAQWLALDALAERHADGTLKLTTRQGVQFHAIRRGNLRAAIAAVDAALLTTLAACGDVVRNVIASPAPIRNAIHLRLEAEARRLSSALLPSNRAHHEIFLGEEAAGEEAPDPLYGPSYLPRKFKIALAHPGDNSADLLANDLGFLALTEGERVTGWIVTLGGGMGMTHIKPGTFPRLADPVALIGPDEVEEVARAAVRLSRDHGDRTDRKHARLKYLLAERGAAWARETLSADLGRRLAPPPPLPRLHMPEWLGWQEQGDGRFWLGLPVAAGRVAGSLRAALSEVMRRFGANPIVTPQQDLLLSDIRPADRPAIERLLAAAGVVHVDTLTPLARWTLACTALPSCGQALAEGERARDDILAQVQSAMDAAGVGDRRVSLRITGCPNGCARPYAGDIGVVGRAPGLYTLFVGGDFEGTRLSFPLRDKLPQTGIGAALAPLFAAWSATGAQAGFGDWCAAEGAERLRSLETVTHEAA